MLCADVRDCSLGAVDRTDFRHCTLALTMYCETDTLQVGLSAIVLRTGLDSWQ